MKNYLEARREELRKRGDKGFTLMEMLIVVAIIAVLIAIAIPVFTTQLERSREATDLANARSVYSEMMAAILSSDDDATSTLSDDLVTTFDINHAGVSTAVLNLKQTVADWQTETENLEIAGLALDDCGTPAAEGTCTIVYDATVEDNADALTITFGA